MLRIPMAGVIFAIALNVCHADEKAVGTNKQEVVKLFVHAFLAEDEKILAEVAGEKLKEDFHSYFWIRNAVHGSVKESTARSPTGKITVENDGRKKVYGPLFHFSEDADFFRVSVGGRIYSIAVNDENKVVVLTDYKANKASEATSQ